MTVWIFIPFILQTVLMNADEYIFHIKRKLPLWERIGHPIDTLSVLSIYLFALFLPFSDFHLKWFIALSIISCLLITKDEFVHKHHCDGSEQWLHAVLFINHPILLTSIGLCWPRLHGQKTAFWVESWLPSDNLLWIAFVLQSALITGFMLYQIIYWNVLWKEKLKS